MSTRYHQTAVNVRNAGSPSRGIGTFAVNTNDPITKISDERVTKDSRIILMPTNQAAATLMGSDQCLFVLDKMERIAFRVATANGKVPNVLKPPALFDYLIDP